MATKKLENKKSFYVKFDSTRENLALLAFLQTLKSKDFVVYDSFEDMPDFEKLETTYSDILSQLDNYNPVYDDDYLAKLSAAATPGWKKIGDTDKWLRELREVY